MRKRPSRFWPLNKALFWLALFLIVANVLGISTGQAVFILLVDVLVAPIALVIIFVWTAYRRRRRERTGEPMTQTHYEHYKRREERKWARRHRY